MTIFQRSIQSIYASIFILIIVLISSSYAISDWDGQWTDNWGYGKSQYICADDQTGMFTAVWSRAGLLVGKLGSGARTVTGNWYEAGTGPCYTGTFSWTLSADNNTITGTYQCSDGSQQTTVRETRIDSNYPTSEQCGRLYTTTVAGHWVHQTNEFDIWDICIAPFASSYSFPTNDYAGDAQGFTYGVDYEKSRIISGRWVEANGAVGVSIGYRTEDNELINLVWTTQHPNSHLNPTSQPIVFRFTYRSTANLCKRNSYLTRPYGVGAAITLTPSVILLVLATLLSVLSVLIL